MNFDCVECPLCNASFAKDGLAKRSAAANDIQLVLEEIELDFSESQVSQS